MPILLTAVRDPEKKIVRPPFRRELELRVIQRRKNCRRVTEWNDRSECDGFLLARFSNVECEAEVFLRSRLGRSLVPCAPKKVKRPFGSHLLHTDLHS
jgi:hypothetical protein